MSVSIVKYSLVKGLIYMSNSTNYASAHVRTYEDALRLERQREWHYRQTRRGKFQARMLSLDMLPADTTQDEYESWISDKGAGADAILAFDDEDALNYYLRRQKAALKAVERHLSSCTEALRGIFKNGSNREETICEMAKKKRRASATSDK